MWDEFSCLQEKGHNVWERTVNQAGVNSPVTEGTPQNSPVSDANFSYYAKVTSCFEKHALYE